MKEEGRTERNTFKGEQRGREESGVDCLHA